MTHFESDVSGLLYLGAPLLFLVAAIFMAWRGWPPLRAGCVMVFIAYLPLLWDRMFDPDFGDGPYGYGFVFLPMLAVSVLPISLGLFKLASRVLVRKR
jgi:hypothetical protein